MQDSLLTKLTEMGIEALNWGEMTAKQLLTFIEKQAPEVLEQWIMWNFYTSLFKTVFGIVIIIVLLIASRLLVKHFKDKIFYFLNGASFLILGFVVDTSDWLQILIAEKVWILQNIKELF